MAISVTHLGTLTSTTDSSSFNLGNVTVPTGGGLVVAVVQGHASGTRVISSVSIGGTNGTIHVQNAGGNSPSCIASRTTVSGNQNITVVFSFTTLRVVVDVFCLAGFNSTTPVDTDVLAVASSTTAALTLDFPSGGGTAIYGTSTANSAATCSWSAATEVAETPIESALAACVATKSTSGSGNTETATWSASASRSALAVVWDNTPLPAPVFTSPTTYSIAEGLTAVGQLAGTNADSFAISGGADSADFVLSSDGFLYFKQEPDYSSPADADTNNVYVVDITASNSGGTDTTQTLTITVTDVDRTGMLRPQSATSATYTAHYDASHPTCYNGTPPANNAAVTTLYDRSGVSGVNLTNTNTVTFKTSQSNSGLPAIELTSNDSGLSGSVFTSPNWSEYTIFLVAKPRRDTLTVTLTAATSATNILNVGRSSGNPITERTEGRGSGYAVFSNTKNTADSSTGVPPGYGVLWINGNCYGSSNGSAYSSTITATDTFRIGFVFSLMQADIAEVVIYRGALSVVETASIHQHLMNKWGIAAHEKYAFVTAGNSLTAGAVTSPNQWPSTAWLNLYDDSSRDVEFYNLAQTGGNTGTLARQSSMFDDLREWLTSRGVQAVFIMWHGHNNSSWSASVQSDIETYPAAWRSDGHRALSITISPRGTAAPDTFAANYAANHAWHHASAAPTYVDAIVDTTELPWMADIDAWVADSTYRATDGLHLKEAGYVAFGEFMAPKILEQLEAFDATGGSNYTTPVQSPMLSPIFSPMNPPISLGLSK